MKKMMASYPKMTDAELEGVLRKMEKHTPVKDVAAYIEKHHGVKYHYGNLWRRMSNLGWEFNKRGRRVGASVVKGKVKAA